MHLRTSLSLAGLLLGASIAPVHAQTTRAPERGAKTEAERLKAEIRDEQRRDAERRPEVRELKLVGVKSLDAGELRKALATQESSCKALLYKPICRVGVTSPFFFEHRYLDHAEFQRDVIRLLVFYFRRGYRDARVDTSIVSIADRKVRITMTVTEGLPTVVDSVTVAGIDRALAPRDTIREVRPEVGQPLNMLALDSSVTRLRERIWERGYVDAVLKLTTTVNDTTRKGSIDINVDPKRRVTIGDITIEGNSRISEKTIRNSLTIEKGDIFRISRISNSQRALYESALFRKAVIDTAARDSSAAPDSVKGLVVQVVEGPQREARSSFGFTTADFFQVEGAFTHNYLLNRPLRLEAGVAVGNLFAQQLTKSDVFVDISDIVKDNDLGRYYAPTYQASVDLTQRWFGSPRNTVGAGLFVHRRSLPGVLVDRGYGANATFTRLLATRVPLSVRYQFEETNVEAGDVYFCVNYGVCDKSTIDALRGNQRLSPLSFTLSIDRTDIPFSPTRGILARAEVEHASKYTASDFRYNRAMAEAAVYRKIGFRGSVVAAHLKAGWVDPLASTAIAVDDGGLVDDNVKILHPRKRFYAGGSQSVRGFGENQLGPRVLTIAAATLDSAKVFGKDSVRIPCVATAPSPECLASLKDGDFQTRPLGGTTLLEGGVEVRIPLVRSFVGALFIDGAVLGNGSVTTITKGKAAFTPGFGIRYKSPVGPIRVDLGIRPTLKAPLPVITEVVDVAGVRHLVDLTGGKGCTSAMSAGCRLYPGPLAKQSFVNRLTNRLTLHLSIGEAY
ncbi:MAG: BamA/TamA family outer membrane protein [Gemmatimonas sp.]